jgi:hypothetical protein
MKGGKPLTKWIRMTAAMVLAGGILAQADDNDLILGAGIAHLRRPPRVGSANLELNHWVDDAPWGGWISYDYTQYGAYIGVGPMARVRLGSNWILAASSGPGYCDNKVALNLGDRLEFRSTLYLFHEMGGNVRWGIAFGHYSNAGLGQHNPGAEYVRFLLSVPVGI